MLKRVGETREIPNVPVRIGSASFPVPFPGGLEYSSPVRGTWNIVHTGMLIPGAHQIFVCAAGCLRGTVLTAAEMHAEHRFSTVAIREHNLLDGTLEDLIIDGVSDILRKLPEQPPAVLVYTSCIHHFAGCDLNLVYRELESRFPEIDFTDCYMNPIMRKSGLTPDQLMRSRLYTLLKPRPVREDAVAIIGNDLPTMQESDLIRILRDSGFRIHEITSCRTYPEYQEMAESAWYISYYPAARAGGDLLSERLGGRHLYLPVSFRPEEIDASLERLSAIPGIRIPDSSRKREETAEALDRLKNRIGDTPVSIDYTYTPRPLSLARILLDAGIRVRRVYADAFTGEEKEDFMDLSVRHPDLELYPTVHPGMRFLAGSEGDWLAVGQKAAYFTGTNHFVNVVEGGGMFGYQAVLETARLMEEAFETEKDMRSLVQIKGLGCEEGCCGR